MPPHVKRTQLVVGLARAGHGVHDGRHRTILADRGIDFLEEAGNSNCGDREIETLPNH